MSTEKKIRVYELAVEALQVFQDRGYPLGFCAALSLAELSILDNVSIETLLSSESPYNHDKYLEIYKAVNHNISGPKEGPYAELVPFRPQKFKGYWFDMWRPDLRIAILDLILSSLYDKGLNETIE